jgi:hypothetical protein
LVGVLQAYGVAAIHFADDCCAPDRSPQIMHSKKARIILQQDYARVAQVTKLRVLFVLPPQSCLDALWCKLTCPKCGQNVWANPDAPLICGVCHEDQGEVVLMLAEA